MLFYKVYVIGDRMLYLESHRGYTALVNSDWSTFSVVTLVQFVSYCIDI